jgi:hypothetical protein
MAKTKKPTRFYVYVVRLDRAVLKSKRFAKANPEHNPDKPCVYVGQSVQPPEERFAQHKRGYRASPIVKKHGTAVIQRLCDKCHPKSRAEAEEMEEELAIRLRRKGYAVWYN